MNLVAAFFCGIVFGLGLAMSGMTDVNKVIGFLDLAGDWDPTLMFVMGGGVLVSLPFFQFGLVRMARPLLDEVFRLPSRSDIDVQLVLGAALFGIGWGLVGLCPGPAIASLAYVNFDIQYFVLAMFAGMYGADLLEKLLPRLGQA